MCICASVITFERVCGYPWRPEAGFELHELKDL